jgi:uncharacterized membrane protein YphA (DoxX/SURF4 family)
MTVLFVLLTILTAAVVAWKVVPAGHQKLLGEGGSVETFNGLFGKHGDLVRWVVGVAEIVGPITLCLYPFTIIGAAILLPVLFGAVAVHALIWKQGGALPVGLFILTLLSVVFASLAGA